MAGFKWETCIDKQGVVQPNYAVAFPLFLLTAYTFVGIAIASDIFMNAIEKICSATRRIKETKEEDGVVIVSTREVLVWNDTVANLTLMALGSSAPEILLSVIEISQGLGKQDPGDLGPGTIVGSAAFNLMIISALCIIYLKNGQTSRIRLYNVFTITCCSSLFAYLWMVVVLELVSPDEIELWEALITLFFFPLLVAVSYWADQDFCVRGKKRKPSVVSDGSAGSNRAFYFGGDEDDLYDSDNNVRKQALQNLYFKLTEVAILTSEEIATILATKLIEAKRHSRSWYRMQAAKALMGAGSGMPVLDDKLKEVIDVIEEHHEGDGRAHFAPTGLLKPTVTSAETYQNKAVVEFQAAALAVAEAVGSFYIIINRHGKEDVGFKLKVDTFDGTAKADFQYQPISQIITFDPYVNEQNVAVHIIDNSEWNPDSNFYLKLSVLPDFQEKAIAGQMRVIEIIIQDDDKPGKLSFTKRGYIFKDTAKVGYLEVERSDGNDGTISVTWKLTPGPKCTLVPEGLDGTVKFEAGEMRKTIEILFNPVNGPVVGKDETFDVELSAPQGGAKLGKTVIATCAISGDEMFKLEITHVLTAAILKSEAADEEVSYKDQIKNSIFPNDGDWENASWQQWILHVIVFPFKLILSLIPPPAMGGGWPCFILALFAIGLLTKLVGDAAGNLGNCVGIDAVITAVTFVALGTSLPDTFASMIAAKNDKTADNAIGNVTGSNSVNVFLGLGLPWTLGAIYYLYVPIPNPLKGGVEDIQSFCVPRGSLTFNVVVFSICAFVTIAILVFRRFSPLCGKAELGGPGGMKWATAVIMIVMWIIYIILTIASVKWKDKVAYVFSGKAPKQTVCNLTVALYKTGDRI